jgi:hypothetical protein
VHLANSFEEQQGLFWLSSVILLVNLKAADFFLLDKITSKFSG